MNILLEKPTVEYCEKAGHGFVARPFYAVSNFTYFFVAFLILKKSKDSLAKLFATSTLLIGLFSLIYDIWPKRITQLFDLTGMFLFVSMLLAINLTRLIKIKLRGVYSLILIITGITTLMTSVLGGVSGNIIFGVIIIGYIALELIISKKQKVVNLEKFYTSIILFILGFGIWLVDFLKIYCVPGNFLNGRGVFHLITATTVYLLYQYYASNNVRIGLK